jgi:hypothetical protein
MNKQASHYPHKASKSSVLNTNPEYKSDDMDDFLAEENDAGMRLDFLCYKARYDKNSQAKLSKIIREKDSKRSLWRDDIDQIQMFLKKSCLHAEPDPEPEFQKILLSSTSHKTMGLFMHLLQGVNLMHGYVPAAPSGTAGNIGFGTAFNIGAGVAGNTVPVSGGLSGAQPSPVEKAPSSPGFIAGFLQTLSEAGRAISDAIAYYDPLKIPIPAASAAPAVEHPRHACHSVDVNADAGLPAANAYVARLLCIGWPDDIGLSEFLRRAIRFQDKDPKKHRQLVSAIQQGYGLYGGHVGESISDEHSNEIMHKWLSGNIFDGDMNTFILGKIVANSERPMSIAHLNTIVAHENLIGRDAVNGLLQLWLFGNVIVQELPILLYLQGSESDKIGNLSLHDWDWGLIHAGILFAKSTGLFDVHTISSEEALGLGKMLLAQLNENLVPAHWRNFFKLPAMMRYLMTSDQQIRDDDLSNRTEAIFDDYFSGYEADLQKNNPFITYEKLSGQQKTRGELAKKLIPKACKDVTVESYLSEIRPFCKAIGRTSPRKNKHPNILTVVGTAVVHTGVESGGFYLKDIDKEFAEQNSRFAEAYGEVDRFLITNAFSRLADDDGDFLLAANVKRAHVEFSAVDKINRVPGHPTNPALTNMKVPLVQDVEFLLAQKGNEERIYALEVTVHGYRVRRVDRDRKTMLSFLGGDTRPRKNSDFALNVYPGAIDLKVAGQALDEHFIQQIVDKHKKNFKEQLHAAGYEETSIQKYRKFIFSLIPFYSCIKSLSDGEIGNGTFSCIMDIASLLPLAGSLMSTGTKFSQALLTGGMITMRNAVAETAVRQSFKQIIKSAGTDFIRYGAMPAMKTVNIGSLSVATFRVVDPFFELGFRLGFVSVQKTLKFAAKVSHIIPEIADFLRRMPAAADNLALRVDLPPHVMASQKQGMKKTIPVVRLGGDEFNNKAVYASLDLETGEVYGAKYTLESDNVLVPVPAGVARNLKNSYKLPSTIASSADLEKKSKSVLEKNAVEESSQSQSRQQSQVMVKAVDVQVNEPALENVRALGRPDENAGSLTKGGVSDRVAVERLSSDIGSDVGVPVGKETVADATEEHVIRIGIPFRTVGDMNSPIRQLDAFDNEIYYRTMSEEDFAYLQRTGTLRKGKESSISPSLEYSSNYTGITVRLTVQAGTSAKLHAIAISANGKTQAATGVDVKAGQWSKHVRFKSEGNQMTTQLGKGDGLALFNENLLQFEQVEKIQKLNRRDRRAIRHRARNNHVSSRLRKNAGRSRRSRYSGPMT